MLGIVYISPPSSCNNFKAFEITAIQFREYWARFCLLIGWLSWAKLLIEKNCLGI